MGHIVVPEAEEILDKEYPVLNKGFIRLVDYMGGDQRIVQAARVSYGDGTKTRRKDKGLINYLLRNRHTSPFEQVIFTFHVKLPIFVARQWIRHRTARLNELSGRYSVMPDEFYLPEPEDICAQSSDNKQGRGEELSHEQQQAFLERLKQETGLIYSNYQESIDNDVSRELARVNLPLSLYTQWYWQIDLHNLFHFLRLRLDSHAQLEIRRYAEVMAEIVKRVVPIAYEAFEEHILYGKRISQTTCRRLTALLEKHAAEDTEASELLEEIR